MCSRDGGVALTEVVDALFADELEAQFGVFVGNRKLVSHLDQVGVEAARKAAVGGHDDDQDALFGTHGQQWMAGAVRIL